MKEEAVVPSGVASVGVNGSIAKGIDIEAMETRKGQTQLALGGDQHNLRFDNKITPGRQAAVEVSGAGLRNGDEADRLAVATISRDVLKEPGPSLGPSLMVDDRRKG